jgi:hypothetical protein
MHRYTNSAHACIWSPIRVSQLWHRRYPSALPLGSRVYYLAQFAFYAQDLALMLLSSAPKRVDHSVYVCHHLVTLALIGVSYVLGWTRSGLIIMVLHDSTDLFLHLGRYGKFWPWRPELLAAIAWIAFVSSYVLNRLIYYPQIVISIWTDSQIHHRMLPREHLFLSLSLSLLQVLHLIWFGFIVRSVKRSCQRGRHSSTHVDARKRQVQEA